MGTGDTFFSVKMYSGSEIHWAFHTIPIRPVSNSVSAPAVSPASSSALTSTLYFVKGFSTEQIIRDIAGRNSDITVEYKVLSDEQTQAIRTFASATPMPLANESSVKIEAIATFTGYNLNGRILYGSMVFTFSATTTDNSKYEVTDYTAGSTDSDGQSHSLRISIGTYTESVTLENLSGTIEASAEISTGSSEASITITSITEDAYNGSFNVGGENVPAAVASGEFDEGEDGTEANPYSLDNLDDLKKLSNFSASDDSKIYAELTGSITISMSDYIDAFSNIVLDGNGYSITTIGTSDNSNAVYYVFEGVTNSTIRNLTYNINSEKPLIQQTRGDVILDGIILNGHVDITGNNTSGFVSYAYPITGSGTNSTLTFNNCVNNADFIDSMGSYGAPFVAIVLASDGNAEGVNLEFNNCENNGDIFYANGAGLLVGNMYRADNDTDNRPETWFYPSTITVNNFTNAGSVNSFKRAEFINFRNRAAKEQDRFRQHGIIDVLTALLPALDDMDRIREHDGMDDSFKAVAAKIDKTFEKFGVEKFGVKGEEFDPTKHEAILHRPDPQAQSETVDAVVEAGYRIGDRVIRAARVVVASPQQ